MKIYKTSEIATLMGVHSNTVRLYETLGFITTPIRQDNGYRVFTDLHIAQFQLARKALQIEVLQNGLRKKAIAIVKLTALGQIDEALVQCEGYIQSLEKEIVHAHEAIKLTKEILNHVPIINHHFLTRKEASKTLGITMDTLRNWEMNGLLTVKRSQNGYRVYTDEDIKRLTIIHSLRCANYSLSAILRMLNALDDNDTSDIDTVLNTLSPDEPIIYVCDQLIVSLNIAKDNGFEIQDMLHKIKFQIANPPL